MPDQTKKPEQQPKIKSKPPDKEKKAPPDQPVFPNDYRYEDAEGSQGELRPPSDS